MKSFSKQFWHFMLCVFFISALSACASKQSINLKIHTDPEGSHVVYSVSGYSSETPAKWIYLGVTPFKGMTVFEKDAFDSDSKISIKVMQNGYLDQVKEWSGDKFLRESNENNMIFWTPHLVRSSM